MATNLGLASLYNVFVFKNMNLSNTDAEGRVAVGGNAILRNYGVGASISPLPPANTDPSFVVNGDIDVLAGSNASGNTVISPTSSVINYTMGNPNGSLIVGMPVDFFEAETYLKCASGYWNGLDATGTGAVLFGQLTLTGTNEDLNIFNFDSTNVYGSGLALNQLNGINIVAPLNATILINVRGTDIQFGSYQIFRNGLAASRENAKKILWNFYEALTWTNSTTAIYGSVLAPFATANTTFSQINGNIVFDTFLGNAESHNELFQGVLPEPEMCIEPITSTTSTTSSTSSTTSTTSSTSSTTSTTSSTTSTSTTSSTTSSTSTTTTSTTSTTSSTTTTTQPILPRSQAISDVIESIVLQQVAISHILNAEGEKLQKILSFEDVSYEDILAANKSVESMVNSVSNLEMVLRDKMDLFSGCKCQYKK